MDETYIKVAGQWKFEEAFAREHMQCEAQRRARDAEPVGELLLGIALPRRHAELEDVFLDALVDGLAEGDGLLAVSASDDGFEMSHVSP